MTVQNDKSFMDPNSIMIRLKQIREGGKVTITHDNISIYYEFSENTSSFAQDTKTYKRVITYDELVSLKSAIDLLNEKSNIIYDNYLNFFDRAHKIQHEIQKLYLFGKTFVIKDYVFIDLIGEDSNIFNRLKELNEYFLSNYKNNELQYPPFLTTHNLLYFGTLLQKKDKAKNLLILKSMFPFNSSEINDIIEEVQNDKNAMNDPLKASITMFRQIYNELSNKIRYHSSDRFIQHDLYQNNFLSLQKELKSFFTMQNLLVIKVNKIVETFHVLKVVYSLLYNDVNRIPYFFENFFCFEDSDIETFLNNFENNKFGVKTNYSFIIHPEFLSSHNKDVLREKIYSRMIAIPEMILQKFVIITASDEFLIGKKPEELESNEFFKFGEISIRINSDLMRKYTEQFNGNFFFEPKIVQSKKPGQGKSIFINSEIEKIKKEKINVRVFHHFIVDSNQRIPIESFNCQYEDSFNVIHFQFSDKIMKKGIKFWSHLLQLYLYGFVFPTNEEPFVIQHLHKNVVFFEIPQYKKSNDGYPLNDLNEFPIPISVPIQYPIPTNITIENEAEFIYQTKLENHENSQTFISSDNNQMLYINAVLNCFKEKHEDVTNLKDYIKLISKEIDFKFDISFRKLGYIDKYLRKYTKIFLNSFQKDNEEKGNTTINIDDLATFFYALTVSALYTYESKKDDEYKALKGLTFLVVENLFNDQARSNQKKVHFFTTKTETNFFASFKNYSIENIKFTFDFSKSNSTKDILRSYISTDSTYQANVSNFEKTHLESYISNTKMSVPTLFRSSVILNRIFLSQPIIMKGDTGCGKTLTLLLLFEYFKIPINEKKYYPNVEVTKILNCHGGVTIEDVINHLKESPVSSKKHIIFFDELNTSPASSYIEHLLLNGNNNLYNCKFVFIGAINPYKKKQSSYDLINVGLPQFIKNEDNKLNLIKEINTKDTNKNLSEMMYHVNKCQKATEDIIFDFNPICLKDDEKSLYPDEEKDLVHEIIYSLAKYPSDDKDTVLSLFANSINKCIEYIRESVNERAVISYRDVNRTVLIYNFLFDFYNENKKAFKNHDKMSYNIPIIATIISFVLRLPTGRDELLKKIHEDELLKKIYEDVSIIKNMFMKFVYQYTLKYLKDSMIWKFKSTFIHLFVMDICIHCKLPCFVIGKPGTSKSYAIELLNKYNNTMYISTYMSSRTSSPDGIKSQYYDAIYKEIEVKEKERRGELVGQSKDYLYVVFIDEMGNANINPSRPLKFLHGILDHGLVLNETGYSKIVSTIGVSNYTMDFANMNRGVLVCTDLPKIDEILRVFVYDNEKAKKSLINDVESFINEYEKLNIDEMNKLFHYLWPDKEGKGIKVPSTIALRSVYNIRFLIDKTKFDFNDVCRILRELYNSKRLESEEEYKYLYSQCPKNVKKQNKIEVDNLLCFLERICSNNTKSKKSLSLITKNYEILEYFKLFEDKDFIKFLQKKYNNIDQFSPDRFQNFRHLLFAEDFKDKPEEISQSALKIITECIKSEKDNILFVGNHPCFDSCLDLLNVPHSMEDVKERDVTLGSGFSSKFKLTNLDFYIIMIANKTDLPNISQVSDEYQENPFSFAFLDRTETLYLDWSLIAPYYLQYKFKDSITIENATNIYKDIQSKLKDHILYESIPKTNENLHTDILTLYNEIEEFRSKQRNDDKLYFGNKYLDELIYERWQYKIKAVIVTKSKISENIYLPECNNPNIININDTNIQNFEELENQINDKEQVDKEKFIIYKCSTFNNLHFTHLKAFFNKYTDYNIFIIYYGIETENFSDLSSFLWPILGMEDISKHPELENQLSNDETDNFITNLKEMNEDTRNICNNLFRKLFEKIVQNSYNSRNNQNLEMIENYNSSEFKISNLFNFLKDKRNIFIFENDDSSKLSKKSQFISSVYKKLQKEVSTFILFAFGSSSADKKNNKAELFDFLLDCECLKCSFNSYLISNSSIDVYYYLFNDYFDFLFKNKPCLDEDMIKKKFISDKIISIIGSQQEVIEIFDTLFHNYQNEEKEICIIKFKQNWKISKSEVFSLQSYVDIHRFRSIAGLRFEDYDSRYWGKYFISSIFSNNTPTDIVSSPIKKNIIDFRKKSIFEIFESPIDKQSELCIQMAGFIDTYEDNDDYQLFKRFCKDPQSLKADERFNDNESELNNNKNKELILSLKGYYIMSKSSKLDDIKNNEYTSNIFKQNNDFSQEDLDLFNKVWDEKYYNLEWKSNFDILIDEIQSVICQNSTKNPDFRKFLFLGYDYGEPLAIIALRRYLKDRKKENKEDLAKIIDPFFGDVKLVDAFINEIIKKENKSFPIAVCTNDGSFPVGFINYYRIFKLKNEKEFIWSYIETNNPTIAQFVWFHVAFCNPKQYPLVTLLIKNSVFFTDFHCVPMLINSILHFRHILSYNPKLIPIFLRRTTLFENSGNNKSRPLFKLHCFDSDYFKGMQNELNELKDILKAKYKDSFVQVENKSSYEQIKFIYQIYFTRYNRIISEIDEIVSETENHQPVSSYKVYSLLPHMLITNFTLADMLTPILLNEKNMSIQIVEDKLHNLFTLFSYKSYISEELKFEPIPLFTVSFCDDERDFLGFSPSDYINIYKSIHIDERINKDGSKLEYVTFKSQGQEEDDVERYLFEIQIKNINEKIDANDIEKVHLNTYDIDHFYDANTIAYKKGVIKVEISSSLKKDIINAQEGKSIINQEINPFFEEEEEELD